MNDFPYKIGDQFSGTNYEDKRWTTTITDIKGNCVCYKYTWSSWAKDHYDEGKETISHFIGFYTPDKLVVKCYLDDSLFEVE